MTESEPRRILGRTYRELIGGRWAISWIAYLINAPFNLIAIGSNASASGSNSSGVAWVAVWLVGYLAFGLVLLMWNLLLFRHRAVHPVAVSAVIAMGAVAGGLRGLIVGLLAQAWALAPVSIDLVAVRTLTGAALGAILIPLAALTLACISEYRSQRSALLTERRSLQAAIFRDQGVTADLERTLLATVQADLDEVSRTRDPELAREVSRRLWVHHDDSPSEPGLHWSAVLRAAVKRNPFATWAVAGVWAVSSIGTLIAAIGFGHALAQVSFSVIAIIVCFEVGRRVVAHHPHRSLQVFVVTMIVLIALTGPVASRLFDPREWPAGLGLVLVNSFWLPLLAVGAGVVTALVSSSESVLDDLHAQVSESEIEALAARDERDRLRRELAVRLHGTVQSRLLAASAAARDPELAAAMLADLHIAAGSHPVGGLRERLDAVIAPWTALLELSVDLDVDDDNPHGEGIVRVCEEAITNAYRHALATTVKLSVSDEGGAIIVRVRNDGRIPDEATTPGVGTAILNSLAPGKWTLTSGDDGTTLVVSLAAG